jgi:hypothetical protein
VNTMLHFGDQVINQEHLVRAEFDPASLGGEEYYDEDSRNTITTEPRKARLQLTLTSQHMEPHIDDFESGYHVAAASENDLVTLRGEAAESVWSYLEALALNLNPI